MILLLFEIEVLGFDRQVHECQIEMNLGDLDFACRDLVSMKDLEYFFREDSSDRNVVHQDEHLHFVVILIVV